jgi:hypothetical protein
MKFQSRKLNNIVLYTLVIAGIVCMILAFYPTNSAQKKASLTSQPIVAEANQQEKIGQEIQVLAAQTDPSPTPAIQKVIASTAPAMTPSPTIAANTGNISQSAITATPSPAATPTAAPSTEQVSLSINGGTIMSVDVPSESNQCEVLNTALNQGKIQSLNMRYNQDMQTYAVYQINGVGKENSVWWVYKVNGVSPSQGCSNIKVHNDDSIIWEYKGS